MNLYEETELYVKNERVTEFASLLRRIPFLEAEDEANDEYFIYVMRLCVAYNSSQCCNEMYAYWEELFSIEEVEIPYFIFLMTIVSDNSIFIYMHKYPAMHFTYEEILDVTINNYDDDRVAKIISKCEQLFGTQSLYFYREMYSRSIEEVYNETVSDTLASMLKVYETYAEYPTWTFPRKNVPYLTDLKIPEDRKFTVEVTDLQAVAKTIQAFNEDKRSLNEIISVLEKTPTGEIEQYLRAQYQFLISTALASNQEMFEVFGPSHPMPEPYHEIETRYGGSRMFLSLERQFGYKPLEEVIEMYDGLIFTYTSWFTGNCQWCFQKIRRWRHALRMPDLRGGWTGCYCSSGCITEAIIELNPQSFDLLQLWSKIYADIQSFGIKDALEEPTIQIEVPEPPKHASWLEKKEITIQENETILMNKYDDLASLINDYQTRPIIVLFADSDTDVGIHETFEKEKEEFLKNNITTTILFVFFFIDEDSDIEDTYPPELTGYYQEEIIDTVVDFKDPNAAISAFMNKVHTGSV